MILYEDRDLIVCRKPAGIPVQSARIAAKDMVSILNNYLSEKCEGKEAVSVKTVHRLDQPVEGVLVFAKTKRAASELGKQIAQGSMKKIYQAVCCVTEKAQQELKTGSTYTLVNYLVKNGKTNTSSAAGQEDRNAKRAELSFTVLDIAEKYLLAQIDLETGRHHQIRVQMAEAGLPLYGDQKYHPAWKEYLSEASVSHNQTELALCAVSLTFCHPVSGKKMTFTTEPESEAFAVFHRE